MMQKNKNLFIEQIVKGFQNNRGKASVYCFTKDILTDIIYNIIKPFSIKNPDRAVFICVNEYSDRTKILSYIKNSDISNVPVTILTKTYINVRYNYKYPLSIIVGVDDDYPIISKLERDSKFTLCILTKNIMNNEFITGVRSILPAIETNIDNVVLAKENIISPVEENRIGVEFSVEDKEAYDKYTEYIATSVNIFSCIDNIDQCKNGNPKLNISASEFRTVLAKENGWREDLDTTIPFMRDIDNIYNPNALYERACNFYTIAKQRRDFVTDNKAKLDKILSICENNSDKKILIVSKRGEFAAQITKYINENSNLKCGDYHNCIEDKYAVDINGNTIYVKSGVNKGKPRIVGHQAQSTTNMTLYNNNFITILSIKSSSNPKLKIACDIVIFTSPLCDDIMATRNRFIDIEFNSNPVKTFILYCANTIEANKLKSRKENPLINVISDEENFIAYNENSGDIILGY